MNNIIREKMIKSIHSALEDTELRTISTCQYYDKATESDAEHVLEAILAFMNDNNIIFNYGDKNEN